MSLLSASIRTPVAAVARHSEAPSAVEGVSSRAATRGNLFRRNSQDSFRKASVQSTCRNFVRVSRLQVSARQAEDAIRSVPVQVAHELINAGHRCLDVRTREEFVAGHVEGAVNIPYLLKVGPGMTKNHRFLEEVEGEFGKDDELVVSCQSGRRSMMAAAELRAANFTGITDMGGGYLAWKESGLPTVHQKRTPSPTV
ncbi:hypothetical protein M758_9G129800 [Ceratodon purpureus]|nr:hypothetical protein M758_9G129800 [Ceratodon purpureus]